MTKIQLNIYFSGKETREQVIPPGVYDSNDVILLELGQYLVDNGHAVDVTPAPDVPVIKESVAPVKPQGKR